MECRRANRDYQRARDRARRRPDETLPQVYVDASEVRDHLWWLATQGLGLRTVALRSGVARSTLDKIRSGRRVRCTIPVADRVLAVGLHRARPGCLVDAAPTWVLVDEMLAHGWTRSRLAALLGSKARRPALQIGRRKVSVATAERVRVLYETLMADMIEARRIERDRQRTYRSRRIAQGHGQWRAG